MILRDILLASTAFALTPVAATPTIAQTRAAEPTAQADTDRAKIDALLKNAKIAYQSFTLPNGLRVIVRPDHRASKVFVGMWYDVGSKHEPAGRSGFAHLFEHLMFNGSENVPGNFVQLVKRMGGSANGNTSFDRTHYMQFVPTQALERALYMESDRMGYLLGAVRQDVLDGQRGVVKNEKRQGDRGALGIVGDTARELLYPAGHPYRHDVIGSMRDLDAATIDDVRRWFKAHYAPNNATLVLGGDIDLPTARRLVTRYFGAIPAGPRTVRPTAGPVRLTRTVSQVITAPVTSPVITVKWSVPGTDDATQSSALRAAVTLLSSDLQGEPFQQVRIDYKPMTQAGEVTITATVRPAADVTTARAALDAMITRATGHEFKQADVDAYVRRAAYTAIDIMTSGISQDQMLGEGAVATGSPDQYQADREAVAALTPAMLAEVTRAWLSRPRAELVTVPGPAAMRDDADVAGSAVPRQSGPATATDALPRRPVTREPMPAVGPTPPVRMPVIERARLGNGIPVVYVRDNTAPVTAVSVTVDGGLGTRTDVDPTVIDLTYTMLREGRRGNDDRLGISTGGRAFFRKGYVSASAPSANAAEAITVLTEMLVTPTFPVEALEQRKKTLIDRQNASAADPAYLADLVSTPLFNPGSPHNRVSAALDPDRVSAITRDDIVAAYHRLIRPDTVRLQVVSSRPLADLLPLLDRGLGRWTAPGAAPVVPTPVLARTPVTPQIVLIDVPDVATVTVTGGQPLAIDDRAPDEAIRLADEVLGSASTARLNMNLRQEKNWSYGVRTALAINPYGSSYSFIGDIQPDKVGDAIAEVRRELRDIVGSRPITQAELEDARSAQVALVFANTEGRDGTSNVLEAIGRDGRIDKDPKAAIARLKAVTVDQANAALRAQLRPDAWSWVVVGDARTLRPQLDKLGLPVTVRTPAEVVGKR